MTDFWQRLKQRKLVQWALAYIAAAFALIQVVDVVAQRFGWPDRAEKLIILALAVGFFVTLVLAWYHGERGAQKVSSVELLILTLLLAVGGGLLWRYAGPTTSSAVASASSVTPAPSAKPIAGNSIAVMPFADLSAAQDQALFSEGMAEEILNALTRVKDLRVLGRSSSFQFQGKNISPQSVGQQLGVAHVLTGSVRKQGNELRITVELVRTSDGVQQWSNQYDGSLADVFKLQDACARDVASQLDITLSDAGARHLVDKVTDNPQAYARFVEAQELVTRRFGDSLPRAIVLLDEATQLDPNFAKAWAKLAVAQAVVVQYVGGDWDQHWQASEAAARRAMALDPNIAEAYAVIGYVDLSRRHYLDMVVPGRRSLELDPDDITANFWLSNQLGSMGRVSDAEALVDHALRRDPDNPLLGFYKANLLWMLGQNEPAVILARRTYMLGPLSGMTLGYAAAAQGDVAGGARYFAKAMVALGTKIPLQDIETIAIGAYTSGTANARAIAVIDRYKDDEYAPTFLLMLGEPERSFAMFEHSQSGLSDAYFDWLWMKNEAWSKKARQSPAFQGFAQRLGMVDYWKRYGWPDLCKPAPKVGPDAFTCQ